MKALLLAAGFGTRLRPLTNTVPKCLVPVKNKPLLEIWLERLSAAGISNFTVNTHYLAERVVDFIDGSRFKEQVRIVYEPELLGTAGTLLRNLDFAGGDDLIFLHADNYCLANLHEFMEAHMSRPAEAVMTMMVFRTSDPSSCGIVESDGNGLVRRFHEKVANPPGNLANGAVYILSNSFLKKFKSRFGKATDFSTQVLPFLMGQIYIYETSAPFMDIGTPANLLLANNIGWQA